jgi:outer membrane protein OmpA-like peptidoglycan-associated protein
MPADVLKTFASKLGIGSGVVTSALAIAIPKVIGLLTPGGSVPTGVPASVSSFLGSSAARLPSAAVVSQKASSGMGKWLIPGLILLGLLGAGWYLLTGKPADKVASTPAVTAFAVQPKITLSNDDGVVSVTGVVKDEGTRSSIIETLKAVFGLDNVKGDINVNPAAEPAAWLANLKTAVENFKIPGLQALFDGASVSIGGLISDADRDRIIAQLKSLFGANVTVAPLSDTIADAIKGAANRTLAALSALKPGFGGNEVVTALNMSIINFASGSAAVPSFNRAVLQQAALVMKQLPAGTVIEIGGHTDNTGEATSNLQLSQQRAEAVKAVLVQSGVDPARLVAKGYGATQPVATNDTPEGRFQNRRIAYSVAP